MTTLRGQAGYPIFATPDNRLILSASTTTTAGNTTTATALTVPPNQVYSCRIGITDLDATGDDAHVTFSIQTSDDATFTTYQEWSLSVEQAAASDVTGTAYGDAEVHHIIVPNIHNYMRIVAAVDNDTGATATWNAFAVPLI